MTDQIGRYLVRGEIGKGGFGAVFRAWDPVMRRDVAIKILTSFNDPGMLSRFRSEPATTGALKHRNIITVYDFGEHDSVPYLVMELLEGRSLRDAIENGAKLSLPEKVGILAEIARGLWYAHQRGVIHRDIKPANVMLLADGSVKILDFGIARMANTDLTRQTSTGTMIGTPEYMAPEQFEGEDASALSDIWAYGVMCYELLSGRQPFRGQHLAAVVRLVINKDPEPLRTIVPECPEALETIVRMAMVKQSSERYQTLQDLLFDLAPVEAGFRKDRIDRLAAEAQQSIEAGDLDGAQRLVWQALELDSSHLPSQELRRVVQRHRERLALEQRWRKTVYDAEQLLQRNAFEDAIQALEALQSGLGTDSVPDLRADVEARLAAAREKREKAERVESLLAEAQEAATRHDLVAASQRAVSVLSLDSENTVALALLGWVERENASRDRLREEALSKVSEESPHPQAPETAVPIQEGSGPFEPRAEDSRTQPQPPAPPPVPEVLPLGESRDSRRWMLAAGAVLLVAGASAVWWRQYPAGTTPANSRTAGVTRPFDLSKGSVNVPSTPILPDPPPVKRPAAPSRLPAIFGDIPPPPPFLRAGTTKQNPKDGQTYVWIPPGTFLLGCAGDSPCRKTDGPLHQVTISKGFWMGRTEVTQEAWQRVMKYNPSVHKGQRFPVENMSWNSAKSYCEAAGARLPTEAEWEYAARAGSGEHRYGNIEAIAWYNANSGKTTHEVAGKQANAWGLYDMVGNVWEWVSDWHAEYTAGDAKDPQGPATGSKRVMRGGSWFNTSADTRATFRLMYEPATVSPGVGFRCAEN